jgi:hypothetical protein
MTTRKQAILKIRETLKLHVAAAHEARRRIQEKKMEPSSPARGAALMDLWGEKRYAQSDRRDCCLALAYLRGRSYAACERAHGSKPYAGAVASLLKEAGILVTKEMVQAWVDGAAPAMPATEEVAA